MKGLYLPGRSDDDVPRRRGASIPMRVASWITRLFMLTMAAAFGGFLLFAIHVTSLKPPSSPGPAEAIVVLTGGTARIEAAVQLLKSGRGDRLLISGANPVAGLADIRHAAGGDAQLFDCCVDIDYVALDTIGNAEESAKWVRGNAFRSVIVVTNNYHMPRSLLEMRRHLGDAVLEPYPVVNRGMDRGEWLIHPHAIRVLSTEYIKYVAAAARSFIASEPLTSRS